MQHEVTALIRDLGMNAGLLAMLAVAYGVATRGTLHKRREVRRARSRWLVWLGGLLFGGVGILAMMVPVTVAPGVIMDARNVVAALAGAYLPLAPAALAAVIMAIYRESLGGIGVYPALLAIGLNLLVGVAMRRMRANFDGRLGRFGGLWAWLLVLGLGSALVTQMATWTLPSDLAAQVWRQTAVPVTVMSLMAILCVGYLLDNSLYLREREVRLAQSAARLQQALAEARQAASVFTHSPATICIMRPRGEILDVNPAYCQTLGYTREELIGMQSDLLRVGAETQGDNFRLVVARAIQTEGRWQGQVQRRRKNGEVFWSDVTIEGLPDSDGVVRRWVSVGKDLTEKRRMEEEVARAAHYDQLTGLPNRRQITQRLHGWLAQAAGRPGCLAICVLDLDDFKAVVDQVGASASDDVLCAVARVLQGGADESRLVGRLGGDEFVVVIHGCAEPVEALQQLEALRLCVRGPHAVADRMLTLACSGGVTFYPADGGDADMLLRHAHLAMLLAKEQGKNRLCVHDVHREAQVQSQRDHLARIEQAIDQGEMVLYFQPKVRLADGEVIGVESLIRWRHPERGVLAPGVFLDAVQGTPLATRLDAWVLHEALRIGSRWMASGTVLPVSVNLHVSTLVRPEFLQDVQQLLAAYPALPRGYLEIELLESETLHDLSLVSYVIEELARLGVPCSIDDFGTGYSSLAYLQRLPAQIIKIDQSFVRDMLVNERDRTLVRGVISLGKAFGRTVVAEGVETDEHAAALHDMGCDILQGYGIARPMPADDILSWVAGWEMPESFVGHAIRDAFDDLVRRVRD